MKAGILLGMLLVLGIAASGCTAPAADSEEQACVNSGGTVATQLCCGSAGDFPNTCLIGACGCSPENSHEVKVCDCGAEQCWNGKECSSMALEMTPQLCTSSGGQWNECSNRCRLDNPERQDITCITVCEALCECGGFAGFDCPVGYTCKITKEIADALGYCIPEGQLT